MKKLFTVSLFLFLISYSLFSQNVGIGTSTPNASALLDVTATNKGVLVPRVTNAQMLAIASPANGLLVYNTDSACFAYRNATAWVFLKGNTTASNDWSTKGNAGTDASKNFIGTIDDKDVVFRRNNLRAGLIGDYNTSLGSQALNPATTGINNTAIGWSALTANTTGSGNTAIGDETLISNDQGSNNTAIGYIGLYSNTSGNYNTSVGANCLNSNNVGSNNTAIGYTGLTANTTGVYNTAAGSQCLFSNNVGAYNTAVGGGSLNDNQSGNNNIAVGFTAGFHNIAGSGNVFLGSSAGFNETGSNKLYITNNGSDAANTLLYGEFDNKVLSIGGRLGIKTIAPHAEIHFPNTLVNRKVILYEDADNDNQFSGFGINAFIQRYQVAATTSSHVFYAGTSSTTSNELMRITGNGEVGIGKIPFISDNDSRLQVKQKGFQNGVGIEAAGSTNHWDLYVGNPNASLFFYYNGVNKGYFDNVTGAYTANSDRRLKKDITQLQPALNNVMQLQAYQYHYLDNQPNDRFSNGFMAQDVQKIFPDAVVENTMKDGETRLGINYQYFTVLAIKGLQEQQQQIQSQEERIAKLEALVNKLLDKK